MTKRTCRACGQSYEHPAPASMSTKRFCESCMLLPERVREVLERHQIELTRLRREVDKLKKALPAAES
ncbi:MAG: hypothetical protein HYU66_13790 [Armatimonadetes bacterium]|nr:hypothetical protein [Armatimonadota bacterium]